MRKFVYLALFTCLSITATAQKSGATIDIEHYEFGLTLTDADNNIQGNAAIEFTVLKETNTIVLDLISKRTDGKGMSVIAVKDKDQSLQFNHANDLLTINLAAAAK